MSFSLYRCTLGKAKRKARAVWAVGRHAEAAVSAPASVAPAGRGATPAGGGPPSAGVGVGLVLLAAVLWSSSGLFIKVLTVDAFALTGVRSALAALTLAPFVRVRHLPRGRWFWLLLLAFSATQLTFVWATRLTTAANAIALQHTAPAWVFLLLACMTRRVQPRLLPPIVLILGGVAAMLAEPAHGTSLQGNLVGVVTGVSFAVTQLAFSRVNLTPVAAVMFANLASAVVCVGLAPRSFDLSGVAAWEWVTLVYLGGVQIALAFFCFTAGVRRITVAQASILTLVEPLLNPVWVYLVLAEAPSAHGFAGYALILGGIALDFWVRLWWLPRVRAAAPAGQAGA